MSKKEIIIIDGYNVIYKDPVLKRRLDDNLLSAREGLISYCGEWMSSRRDIWLFYVVFDGDSSANPLSSTGVRGVHVVYTETGETADDRILDVVREREYDCSCTVVSDDNYVRNKSRLLGANIMPAAEFLSVLKRKTSRVIRAQNSGSKSGGKVSVAVEKKINDSLKREWGIDQ